MWSTGFLPALSTVSQVRGSAATHLETMVISEAQRDDVLVMVSELVTNAVRHGDEPLELRIDLVAGRLRVEVDDGSQIPPIMLPTDPDRIGGLGIHIIDMLADAWGTLAMVDGKTVWFEIDLA